jgi:hypothetical protein
MYSNSSKVNIIGALFIKILRMLAENHFLYNVPNYKDIICEEIFLIGKIWASKRDNVLAIGKELIRLLIPLAKSNIDEITTVIEDISTMKAADNTSMCYKLLTTPPNYIHINTFSTSFYTCINIPPLMERMLLYLLTDVRRYNYIKYITWMFKKFNIISDSEKTLLTDIARYIITSWSMVKVKSEITPRWLIIGYLLKACKSEVINSEIKQAIFYDWLFYNKDRDLLSIEPGVLVIFNSIKEFSDMTMELIEFLDIYSENFSPVFKTKIRENICEAFKHSEVVQVIPSLKVLIREEKMSKEIKTIFEELTKSKEDKEPKVVYENIDISLTSIPDLSNLTLKVINNEFCIDNIIQELINPITLKNFVSFRSIDTFKLLLDDFCKDYLNKLKSQNLLNKSLNLQTAYENIPIHFAHFYLNSFKDELIQSISTEGNKMIHTTLIETIISKYMEKREKELQLLSNCLLQICTLHKEFIVRVIIILCRNIRIYGKDIFNIFRVVYGNKMKDVLKDFFKICVENLDIDIINYFIEKGIGVFYPVIEDDVELLTPIIIYANKSNLSRICSDIEGRKYTLIDKNVYLMITKSLTANEKARAWDLFLVHDRLNYSNEKVNSN